LANCNYAAQGKRASREEMDKVERYQSEPRKAVKSKEPIVYTPEQTAAAQLAMNELPILPSKEEATKFWYKNISILEVPVEGTTLKDALGKLVMDKGW
jgi:hypothetical protein